MGTAILQVWSHKQRQHGSVVRNAELGRPMDSGSALGQEPHVTMVYMCCKLPSAQTRVALGAKVTGPKDAVSVTFNLLILKRSGEAEQIVRLCQNARAGTIFPEASLPQTSIMYISKSSQNCNHEAVGVGLALASALSGTIKEQTSKASSKVYIHQAQLTRFQRSH